MRAYAAKPCRTDMTKLRQVAEGHVLARHFDIPASRGQIDDAT